MEVLQTSALPLGDGAGYVRLRERRTLHRTRERARRARMREARAGGNRQRGPERATRVGKGKGPHAREIYIGAGNGIRTRDFDLGKVALYH
jgi:hypothetical protein